MESLNQILAPKEKILWKGKPVFVPFLLSGITFSSLIGFFFLIQLLPAISSGALLANLLPLYFMLFILFGPLVYRLMVYQNTLYVITDKRVIFQGGLIATNFQEIDYDQISNATVNIDIFDKFFGNGSGTITISTSGNFASLRNNSSQFLNPYSLNNIANPYKVFKFFEKVAQDIKTDIYYPNDLRPSGNPGYNTKYRLRKKGA